MLINDMISNYRHIFDRVDQIEFVSKDLSNKIRTLLDYKRIHYYDSDGSLKAAMLTVAEEHKLFDMNIYPEYLEMLDIFEKLTFLNPLCSRSGYFTESDQMVGVMTDLFKYYKHKVDLKHYNIRINEEVLTEETIEDLVD